MFQLDFVVNPSHDRLSSLSLSHDFVISNRTFDGIGYERKKKGAGCVEAGIRTMDQSLCRPFEQLELK